jgi:two-component system, LytTR family, response regulator
MMRAIVVDDEEKARNVLKAIIGEHFSDVEIIDMCEDVPAAVKSILRHKPDVVFLDVEMPGYNGFQLLEFFEEIDFNIIFTTAYSEYAIRAFQVSAVDYLLKPIQIEQLETALEKLRKQQAANNKEIFENLRFNLHDGPVKKIALPSSGGVMFVKTEDIIYLKADGSYTHFFLNNGRNVLISRKLKEFEKALNETIGFFRPHRSYIINGERVAEYLRTDGGSVIMDNGDQVPIARDSREDFLNFIGIK